MKILFKFSYLSIAAFKSNSSDCSISGARKEEWFVRSQEEPGQVIFEGEPKRNYEDNISEEIKSRLPAPSDGSWTALYQNETRGIAATYDDPMNEEILVGEIMYWENDQIRALEGFKGRLEKFYDIDSSPSRVDGHIMLCSNQGFGAYELPSLKPLWWKDSPVCPFMGNDA